jgi:phosphatidylinositol alpha-1,6-mannosyltransferase
LHGILRERRPDIVLFGAIWPLGHMGPAIHRKLDIPYGGFSHGLELTGARLPGLLRHIGARAALLTAVSDWARRLLEPAFGWRGRMQLLPSGIDTTAFHPGVSDADVRVRHKLGDAPVVCCVSRLVARKGQDMLIRSLPRLALAAPRVRLLIVGTGPYDRTLRDLANAEGVADRVVFTGAVPYAELPPTSVRAMCSPCHAVHDLEGWISKRWARCFFRQPRSDVLSLSELGGAPEATLEARPAWS